ncbi:hypothetical protein EIP91_004516 [Steccherinum ochraceum]|uniref:Uncharacterized protein n=1 Tax=Steccherinum ochraceum TaxID=92696 RepID=A0A4R0RP36_9APHY|nr:hypothetical protein EIP91_004516 [Steccherinum ochraceum]
MASYKTPQAGWANALVGTPPSQPPYVPYRDSEKGQESPLLAAVPSYESVNTANLAAAPLPQAAPPRRSRVDKFWTRVGYCLALTLVCVFLAPRVYHRVQNAVSYGEHSGIMHGFPGAASDHPECVENARWSNHDEELEHHHGADVYPHDFRHLVKTSFNLPLNSELLYFLAHGTLSHGAIEIIDDGENGDDKVVVDVSLLYIHDVALEKVEVCRLHRGSSGNGVGIFSPHSLPPHHHHDEYRTHFSVTVHLPNGAGNRHFYEAFETDMPIFVHHVGDLDESAAFGKINFKTSNSPIHVQSLTTEVGRVQTSNSPIDGKIAASKALDLHSSNGPLKVDITLSNKDGAASKLVLHTTNSPIRSGITLVSLKEDGNGGSFDINASSSNGPVDLIFPSAPTDSTLKLDTHTSNSPIRVTLHKSYEGSYDMQTSRWSQPTLNYDEGVEDPAGRGRRRVVETHTYGKGRASGNVKWTGGDANARETGSVKLSTSNAGLHLNL